jgi:hypothetical protein
VGTGFAAHVGWQSSLLANLKFNSKAALTTLREPRAMENAHEVKCPCCQTILFVDKRTGKILDERRPILDQSTGDRYQDALKKVKERGSIAEEKFQKFQKEKDSKMAKLDALFKDSVKKVEESGEEVKPVNPFDME